MRVVLDSEAFSSLAGRDSPRKREVRRMMEAAARAGSKAVVPSVVLAELYRPGRLALVDACLSRRQDAIICRDTDRSLARLVGGVLAASSAGSEDMVDAHVVATAIEGGRGIVITGDPDDLRRLAAPYASVTVVPLG